MTMDKYQGKTNITKEHKYQFLFDQRRCGSFNGVKRIKSKIYRVLDVFVICYKPEFNLQQS